MPTPYEPILRHEPIPGAAAQCLECQYDTLNHPCANPECACVCKVPLAPIDPIDEFLANVEDINDHRDPLPPDPDSPALVADWGDGPLQWREPRPETWDPNAEDMRAYAAMQPIEGNIGHHKTRTQAFIAKWEVPWAVMTTMLYLAAVILLVTVFPDVSNTWVSVFVLVSGLTASLTALASVLKTKE